VVQFDTILQLRPSTSFLHLPVMSVFFTIKATKCKSPSTQSKTE